MNWKVRDRIRNQIIECMVLGICFLSSSVNQCYAIEADAESKSMEAFVKFYNEYLSDRTFGTSSTLQLANGRIETEFTRRMMYLPLRRVDDTVEFERIAAIKQSIWDMDSAGKRSGSPQVKDRIVVVSTFLRAMKSADGLHGQTISIASSMQAARGGATPCRVVIEENELRMTTRTPFFSDGFDKSGGYFPVSSDSVIVYRNVAGKTQGVQETTSFEVEPETLKRTTQMPLKVEREYEIEGLF